MLGQITFVQFRKTIQGRAEDFQIGVALRISARAAREKFLSATPKFLSATGIFSF